MVGEHPSSVWVPAVPSCHSYDSAIIGGIGGSLLYVTQYDRYMTYSSISHLMLMEFS